MKAAMRQSGRKRGLSGEGPGGAGVLIPATLSPSGWVVQELIQAARQADASRQGANCKKRSPDVRLRGAARVVPEREPLSLGGEHDLGRDDEARKSQGVNLGTADARAARFAGTVHLVERDAKLGTADTLESLRELAGGPARSVLLRGARVVDHLPF